MVASATLRRRRLGYLALAAATTLLGLASRRYAAWLPAWVPLYAGDVLWALLVYWLVRMLRPAGAAGRAALLAGGWALATELSQLATWPWLVALRHTWWGKLVLGQGFLASDLLCYALGIGLGLALEANWWPRPGRPENSSASVNGA